MPQTTTTNPEPAEEDDPSGASDGEARGGSWAGFLGA
jgi:hypothetical protein